MTTDTLPEASPAAAREPRRRRDPEATRAAILDAAERLLLEAGPNRMPIAEIARQAGVTKSLIHHHFGSKKELWVAVRQRHFGRYHEAQIQLLQDVQGTAELMRDSVVAYFRFLQDDPRAVRFFTWRFLEETEDPQNLDLEEELFELGIRRIREAQASGELRDDLEPLSIIKAFLGMVTNWFQSRHMLSTDFLKRCLGPETVPEEIDQRFLEDSIKIFLEGIRPR